MTYFTVDSLRFAQITDSQVEALMRVPVETFTVSDESISRFREMLEIDSQLSDEDLQALRNGAVFALATKSSILREKEDPRYWDAQKTMSAITAIIDEEKYKRGMAV